VGRNKQLRRRLSGIERQIRGHEAKIRNAQRSRFSDAGVIRGWQPATKAEAPDVHALEVFLDEAVTVYEEMISLRKKLRRLKRGGEAYLDALSEVAVCASVITAKTDTLLREIDVIEDALPDEGE
jgi:hypothetical protein